MAHSHQHSHQDSLGERPLLWSLAINFALSVFQFVAGFISGSAALVADALHNTNDAAALVVAFVAKRISRKRANSKYTFGYRRAELIGALIQLTALVIIGGFLIYHAIERFINPVPIESSWVILGASVALLVDLTTVGLLWATSKGSLNVKAAFLHNLTDAATSLAVLAGGALMLFFGWTWIDPLLTLGIAGFIIASSLKYLARTSRILMEATPEDIDLARVKEQAESLTGVNDLHHLHVWEIDESHRALEAHVVIYDDITHRQRDIKQQLKNLFAEEFDIGHSTLEFERASEACGGKNAKLVPAQ
ncbi:cation diffusion facilitator family transporter [Pelagicoccus sp. SDUM812002]|uniref:cation diffusion facilitator family transporter n=1 Tax=Pelagicoccus sp. SDUM812002 TaxID=3041266 RepID=UPI00280F0AC1|nr:cation diffusion facilitator family transporter [Pelagicoccus sp. SDUM812002]MDQ8188154.1 cation diffusion facilitator family transporter [Pelagicoccus sp. SDUM812002]